MPNKLRITASAHLIFELFWALSWRIRRCTGSIACTAAGSLFVSLRLIDTATAYNNEEAIGEAILLSEVPREEIVIVDKIHPKDMFFEGATIESVDDSLRKLKVLGTRYFTVRYWLVNLDMVRIQETPFKSLSTYVFIRIYSYVCTVTMTECILVWSHEKTSQ